MVVIQALLNYYIFFLRIAHRGIFEAIAGFLETFVVPLRTFG